MKMTSVTSLMLVIALSACARQTPLIDLYGQPAPIPAAERTIVITPNTKHVNVEGGQIVRFVVSDKEFAWNFNTARGISSFSLNEIAPPGVLNHPVHAYISPDPRYRGGNGIDRNR